jgi:glycosyltransferase involved in cell wall biosynthesis
MDVKERAVLVIMVTYNHEQFIEQAVLSVLNQKTNFPVHLLIAEDHSQDKTREICLSLKSIYPEKITLLMEDYNLGIVENTRRVYGYALRSSYQYLAILEGDDFWLSEFKLQRQIDLLESNPACSGSYHNSLVLYSDGSTKRFRKTLPTRMTPNETIATWAPFHTSSFVFKNDHISLPEWFYHVVSSDIAFFNLVVMNGSFVGLDEELSCYREHPGGVTKKAENQIHLHRMRAELWSCLEKEYSGEWKIQCRNKRKEHELLYHSNQWWFPLYRFWKKRIEL